MRPKMLDIKLSFAGSGFDFLAVPTLFDVKEFCLITLQKSDLRKRNGIQEVSGSIPLISTNNGNDQGLVLGRFLLIQLFCFYVTPPRPYPARAAAGRGRCVCPDTRGLTSAARDNRHRRRAALSTRSRRRGKCRSLRSLGYAAG